MSCRILHDDNAEMACLYDSVTMTAFGPIFEDDEGRDYDCTDLAEDFLLFVNYATGLDPRAIDVDVFHTVWLAFHGQLAALRKDTDRTRWNQHRETFLNTSALLETKAFWQALLSEVSWGIELTPWILQTPETPESGMATS